MYLDIMTEAESVKLSVPSDFGELKRTHDITLINLPPPTLTTALCVCRLLTEAVSGKSTRQSIPSVCARKNAIHSHRCSLLKKSMCKIGNKPIQYHNITACNLKYAIIHIYIQYTVRGFICPDWPQKPARPTHETKRKTSRRRYRRRCVAAVTLCGTSSGRRRGIFFRCRRVTIVFSLSFFFLSPYQ